MKEKGRCPHCGRYTSGDILEKLNMQATIKKLELEVKAEREKTADFAELMLVKDKVTNERDALLKSNKLLEEELTRLRERNESLSKDLVLTEMENKRLHKRGWWARLLDK